MLQFKQIMILENMTAVNLVGLKTDFINTELEHLFIALKLVMNFVFLGKMLIGFVELLSYVQMMKFSVKKGEK